MNYYGGGFKDETTRSSNIFRGIAPHGPTKGPVISSAASSPDPQLKPFADKREAFLTGLWNAFGLPAMVLFFSMTGYGSFCKESGLTLSVSVISSGGVWGLPGQIAAVELYAVGAPLLAVITAASMANARFLPMTLALMPMLRVGLKNRNWCYVLTQFISINTWAAGMRRGPTLPPEQRVPYFVGFSLLCISSGMVGTAFGFELAGTMPRIVTLALVFLNPVYFAVLFGTVTQRFGVIALLCGAVAGPVIHLLSPEWGLPVTGVLAGTLAYYLDRGIGRAREGRHG